MKRFRKSVFIPAMLLIYLGVMAYLGRDMLSGSGRTEYFLILIVTLACIALLTFTLRKQEKIRERKAKELEEQRNKQESEPSTPESE